MNRAAIQFSNYRQVQPDKARGKSKAKFPVYKDLSFYCHYLIVTEQFLHDVLSHVLQGKINTKLDARLLCAKLKAIRMDRAFDRANKGTSLLAGLPLTGEQLDYKRGEGQQEKDFLGVVHDTKSAKLKANENIQQLFSSQLEIIKQGNFKGHRTKNIPEIFLHLAASGELSFSAFVFGIKYFSSRIVSPKLEGNVLKNQPYARIVIEELKKETGLTAKSLRRGRQELTEKEIIQDIKQPEFIKGQSGVFRLSPLLEDHSKIAQRWIAEQRGKLQGLRIEKKEIKSAEEQKAQAAREAEKNKTEHKQKIDLQLLCVKVRGNHTVEDTCSKYLERSGGDYPEAIRLVQEDIDFPF